MFSFLVEFERKFQKLSKDSGRDSYRFSKESDLLRKTTTFDDFVIFDHREAVTKATN